MTWTNRVVWQEGMFLRAQHFQQQDRHLDYLARAGVLAAHPYPWGVTEMAIDRDLLATGRFALTTATGLFEDGTPFSIPGECDHPPPLDLPEGTRDAVVYLAVPVRQAGTMEIAQGSATDGRYAIQAFEAFDTHSAAPQPAELLTGRLRLRYMLETEDRSGFLCIGLARVTEVTSDRRAILDDRWVTPCIRSSASPALSGLLGRLNRRVAAKEEGQRRADDAANQGEQEGIIQAHRDRVLGYTCLERLGMLAGLLETGRCHPASWLCLQSGGNRRRHRRGQAGNRLPSRGAVAGPQSL